MNLDFSQFSKIFLINNKGKLLTEGNFGIERESQRVTSSGDLALTPHPLVFGEKGENPNITTDFSESQIEMITPTFNSIEKVYESLYQIHDNVEKGIGDELLWPLSMPPKLPNEELIPVATFSDSEYGKNMRIYRDGLALRYGKKMQMISGIHYNFSFSDEMIDYLYAQFGNEKDKRLFIDEIYFSIIRNFMRYRWLLIYLFGASPSCHSTYNSVISKEIKIIKDCCPRCIGNFENFNEYATSIRVSRFGYSNTSNHKSDIYFNSLEEYSTKLRTLVATKSAKYSELGLHKNGFQIQLNGNILQKESEFYSSIRPKQNISRDETQLDALEKRGIKYIEVRILDLNPFEKLGLSIEQMNFLHVFMLFCLFENSEFITEEEHEQINLNHHLVSIFGRKEDLLLKKYNEEETTLKLWGSEVFESLLSIAKLIYESTGDDKYLKSVETEKEKLFDISLLPSERIHREMKDNEEDFLEFGTRHAIRHLQINN